LPRLHVLGPAHDGFPPLEEALREPDGLLAIGGDLSPERLIAAYRRGVFPWFEEPGEILWWSPDPRAVIFPEELHLPRSLKKRIRHAGMNVTVDSAFDAVMRGCAELRRGSTGTWIGHGMCEAYARLHRAGVAHSVEVWDGTRLAGGLYGIAIGRVFFGESMFARVADASKIAFAHLALRLRAAGFALIDCQQDTEHMRRFGSRCIPRAEFRDILARNIDLPGVASPWLPERSAEDEAWATR
jgi:leucyl/phenylalanyl-tRNA---protein transferase